MSQYDLSPEQLAALLRALQAHTGGDEASETSLQSRTDPAADLSRVIQSLGDVGAALSSRQVTYVSGGRVKNLTNIGHADTIVIQLQVAVPAADRAPDGGPSSDQPLPAPPTTGGPQERGAGTTSATADNLVGQLAARVSGDTRRRLDELRTALRIGRGGDIAAELDRLEQGAPRVWDEALPYETKADILIFAAALAVDLQGDAARAKALLKRARGYARRDDVKVRALIIRLESGSQAALDLLEAERRDDTDAVNLRAAFLLDLGRARDCLTLLDRITPDDAIYTEALRLRALACLLDKRIDDARAAARTALDREKQWVLNRHAAALIDYYGALSPAALPDRLPAWPQPVPLPYVKRDDDSLRSLDRAVDGFRALARDMDVGSDDYRSAQVWLLACLADAANSEEEALAQVRTLLADDAAAPYVITWIVARGYDVDARPTIRRFEALVELQQADLPHLLALVVWYTAHNKAGKAVSWLTRPQVKRLFTDRGAERLWTLWHTQALTAAGRATAALRAIDKAPAYAELRDARTAALYALAQARGAWEALFQHLERVYEDTGKPAYLYECCEAKMQRGEWAYVADRAEELVARCETEAAARLAIRALYRTRRFGPCRDLLDRRLDLFAHRRLPADLRRLKIACLQELAAIPEATTEAEVMVREEMTPENLLPLLQIHRAAGNLPALVYWAQHLRTMRDLTPVDALRGTVLVQHDDKDLARALWRQAIHGPDLPDDVVSTAWALGFNLGCDDEMEPITTRVTAMGQTSRYGIQVMDAADIPALLQGQRAQQEEMARMYLQGIAPVQIVAAVTRQSLVNLYHTALAAREYAPDPAHQPALLARYGGRPLPPGFPQMPPERRLHLDVTALLLAAHLDLLPRVERALGPLYVAADATADLVAMRDTLAVHQPSREPIAELIANLVDRRAVRPAEDEPAPARDARVAREMGDGWADLYGRAVSADGYVVGYLPLRRPVLNDASATLPDAARHRVVNCRSIIDALHDLGAISPHQRDEAVARLGYEGVVVPDAPLPAAGARLFCHGNTIEILADTGHLETICERFVIRVEQGEIERLRASVVANEHARRNIRWLTDLIATLHRGLEDGTYRRVPLVPAVPPDNDDPGALQGERSLRTLLQIAAQPGDILWADDRFMTSYPQQEGGMPIVGVNEVLKALVGVGALTEDAYYHVLIRLRASNVRFIPIESGEILFHLLRAPLDAATGAVIETRPLRTLRRYAAACVLQGNVLQRPPVPDSVSNKAGEMAFLLGLKAAAIDALAGVWESGADEAASRARADWLLRNMYLDITTLRTLVPVGRQDEADLSDEETLAMEAVSVTRLLVSHPPISDDASADKERRGRYVAWLDKRLLGPRFEREPRLVTAVAAHLTDSFLEVFTSGVAEGHAPQQVAVSILAYAGTFPKALHDALQNDTTFMVKIGVQVRDTYDQDGLTFDRDDFYRAAARVIAGEDAAIMPIDAGKPVTLRRCDSPDGHLAICFDNPVIGRESRVDTGELSLLLKDATERAASLRAHRWWLDCDDETLDTLASQVEAADEPASRIELAMPWWKTSAALYYADLDRRGRLREDVRFADLLSADADGLRRHLRLPADVEPAAVAHTLDEAAGHLVREEGLPAAIERFAGLPVPLPTAIALAFDALTAEARRALIKDLVRASRAPLARIHLLYLLRRCAGEAVAYRRLASRVARALIGVEGQGANRTYAALLRWIDRALARRPETHRWAPAVRLAVAWAHAHRILAILMGTGTDVASLERAIHRIVPDMSDNLFESSRAEWTDITHPHRIDEAPDTLLLSGLLYACGDQVDALVAGFHIGAAVADDNTSVHPALILDPARANNRLGSFLAEPVIDHYPSLRLGGDSEVVTTDAVREIVRLAVARLSVTASDFEAWDLIGALLGDTPPAPSVESGWHTVLLATSFVDLVEKDLASGLGALRIACVQSLCRGDDVHAHLATQIVDIARHIAVEGRDAGDMEDAARQAMGELGLILLIDAVRLCARSGAVADGVGDFASLSNRIIDASTLLTSRFQPLVQRLYEQLPSPALRHLAPLLVRLRTLP